MNIVITGTSSGIGLALTSRLLGKGHRICGLARSDQSPQAARRGGSFQAIQCDVSNWEMISRAAEQVAASSDHLDALITCAGVQGEMGRAVQADPQCWSDTVRKNLDGTYFAIRAFYSLLRRAQGRAKIVCFSGGGATKARPNFSAYAAAKTAVVRLVETLAEEEKMAPLDINALAPGAINTRLTDEVIALGPSVVGKAEYEAAVKQKADGGASIDQAIDAVEWMISPESDGISGRILSALWDPIAGLKGHLPALSSGDIYTLRRITPEDRGQKW